MLISFSRRRKLLVEASLRRIRVSLCWTSGWSTRWTLFMRSRCSRGRSVGALRRRCRRCRWCRGGAPSRSAVPAPGRRPRCRLRARRPAAARSACTPSASRTRGASSSSSATVRARHSTMNSSPTAAQALRRSAGSLRHEHAAVDAAGRRCGTRAGRSGRRGRATVHAGPFERLEQRVAEPLRQLVERHPAGGERRGRAPRRGASSRRAAGRRARCRWARPTPACRAGRRAGRAPAARPSAARPGRRRALAQRMVEQAAGPAVVAEDRRAARPGPRRAGAAARRGPSRPTSGLPALDLEGPAERGRRSSRRRPAASTCSGCAGSVENRPATKAWKLATPRPSERVKR